MQYSMGVEPRSSRDYAAELNPEQYAAVTTTQRHALVIAGAGSGKTRTLTYRVAWLLDQGVAPWRILLLTFTNKAAREMLQRVEQLTGAPADRLWGGTFHSVANRLLRRHAELLGYRPGFTIMDSDDQKALMRALVREYAPKESRDRRFPKAELLLGLHSLAANTERDWLDVLLEDYPQFESRQELIGQIFEAYAERKRQGNCMDFDDLLLNLLRLLREHENIRDELRNRFCHVLVDEYQDTNAPQEEIIRLIAGGPDAHLMVVGDDAQSIYSWRGADVRHILSFGERYPDAVIYRIETNYRSVPAILAVSNVAIAGNTQRYEKELRSARPAGSMLPAVVPAPDNRTEAAFVARRIDELLDAGIAGRDIAVLYRAHFHSLDVQMELTRRHIPFRITSGLRFFEQAHVKDVVAFLRLLVNPRDEVAFRRIAGTFPGVGDATAAKLLAAWNEALEAWQTEHPGQSCPQQPHSEVFASVRVAPKLRPYWAAFLSLMDSLHPAGSELTPAELVGSVVAYLSPYLRSTYENWEEREEDLSQLSRTIDSSGDLDEFLSQVALLSEADKEVPDDDDCVTLSTIHQAKGLEWKVVFVIFLGEGLFPNRRVLESGDLTAMEEETRLFYVAVTRAEDQLYLSYPRYNGRGYDRQYCPPSRYLTSLPPELYDLWELN